MSVTALNDFYFAAYYRCRLKEQGIPRARDIQELMQAWKALRKGMNPVQDFVQGYRPPHSYLSHQATAITCPEFSNLWVNDTVPGVPIRDCSRWRRQSIGNHDPMLATRCYSSP